MSLKCIWNLFLITSTTNHLIQVTKLSFWEAITALGLHHHHYYLIIRNKNVSNAPNLIQVTSLFDKTFHWFPISLKVFRVASKVHDDDLATSCFSVSFCFPFSSFIHSTPAIGSSCLFSSLVGKLMPASVLCHFSSLCLSRCLSRYLHSSTSHLFQTQFKSLMSEDFHSHLNDTALFCIPLY